MIIVLEGPDNGGKTSLALPLMKHAAYVHAGGAPDSEEAERVCLKTQQRWLDHKGANAVLDRVTCLSQSVYNRDNGLEALRAEYRERLIKSNAVVIYCRPPNERLIDVGNFTWRPDETEEHRQKIIERAHEWVERYDALMKSVPCISYDYTDPVYANLIQNKLAQALSGDPAGQQWLKGILTYRSW